MALHVSLSSGGVFTGDHAYEWNLDEATLRAKYLEPRAEGRSIYRDGTQFRWPATVVRIFEGPCTDDIEDFSAVLGPDAYALTGVLSNVSDLYITAPPGDTGELTSKGDGRAVFVVHGRSQEWQSRVADFLQQVLSAEHDVVVLHEQPDRGRTVIEKLEDAAAAASFAVVVITADDEGRLRGSSDELEARARQNVILELGFFFAKLGRDRVAVLYESETALPSDAAGIAYTRLDPDNGWRLLLHRELKAAGLDSDVSRLRGM